MDDNVRKVWEVMDESRRRREPAPSVGEVIRVAKERGIDVNVHTVQPILRRYTGSWDYIASVPHFITDFVVQYLSDKAPKMVLDPLAGVGAFLDPIVARFGAKAIGINRRKEYHEATQLLHNSDQIEWRLGSPIDLLDEIESEFDAVVGVPPFGGMRSEQLVLETANGTVELHDESANLTLAKAASRLTPQGTAFFIVPRTFVYKHGKKSVYGNFKRLGLTLDAVLSLPAKTFSETSIPLYLIIITRRPPTKLFIGELSSDADNSQLLKNLRARMSSKKFELGALVEREGFYSYEQEKALSEIETLVRATGYPPVPIADIALDINPYSSAHGFKLVSNAVYLPRLGTSPAVVSPSEFSIQPENYVQIICKPEYAVAEYLAGFFNTPLGLQLRAGYAVGAVPRIPRKAFGRLPVVLPPQKVQVEVIKAQTLIVNLSTQLTKLQSELWERPRKVKEVTRAVTSLNQNEDLDNWLETLPFPLASILWSYRASRNPEEKFVDLLHFFEATALFHGTVMLSALRTDYRLLSEDESIQIREKLSELNIATFASWRNLASQLAAITRRLLSSAETGIRARCVEAYGSMDFEFLEMLTNKKHASILEKANEYRNDYKGHEGKISKRSYQERLALLEGLLADWRGLVGDHYSAVHVVSPAANEFSDGIYSYTAKRVMGTRYPFQEISLQTLVPMDKSYLYILDADQQRPVQLIPFVRLIASPETEQNACYFYNRMEDHNGKIRWVSYHFEAKDEVWDDQDTAKLRTSLDTLLEQFGSSDS